jgi:hypothetical protein
MRPPLADGPRPLRDRSPPSPHPKGAILGGIGRAWGTTRYPRAFALLPRWQGSSCAAHGVTRVLGRGTPSRGSETLRSRRRAAQMHEKEQRHGRRSEMPIQRNRLLSARPASRGAGCATSAVGSGRQRQPLPVPPRRSRATAISLWPLPATFSTGSRGGDSLTTDDAIDSGCDPYLTAVGL